MSAEMLNVVANTMGVLAFGAAFAGVLAMPSRPGGFMRGGIKLLLGGAMAVYLFVSVSHILQFTGASASFDVFENYLKTLFIPLVASAAYALRMNEQLRVTQRQSNVLSAEHDILMRIVDTTPTGMVVIDTEGRIEFANERAHEMLELEEDRDTSRLLTPEWVCDGREDAAPGDLTACLVTPELRDRPITLIWPDGTTRRLSLNATPIIAADGSRVGSVLALTLADPASAA